MKINRHTSILFLVWLCISIGCILVFISRSISRISFPSTHGEVFATLQEPVTMRQGTWNQETNIVSLSKSDISDDILIPILALGSVTSLGCLYFLVEGCRFPILSYFKVNAPSHLSSSALFYLNIGTITGSVIILIRLGILKVPFLFPPKRMTFISFSLDNLLASVLFLILFHFAFSSFTKAGDLGTFFIRLFYPNSFLLNDILAIGYRNFIEIKNLLDQSEQLYYSTPTVGQYTALQALCNDSSWIKPNITNIGCIVKVITSDPNQRLSHCIASLFKLISIIQNTDPNSNEDVYNFFRDSLSLDDAQLVALLLVPYCTNFRTPHNIINIFRTLWPAHYNSQLRRHASIGQLLCLLPNGLQGIFNSFTFSIFVIPFMERLRPGIAKTVLIEIIVNNISGSQRYANGWGLRVNVGRILDRLTSLTDQEILAFSFFAIRATLSELIYVLRLVKPAAFTDINSINSHADALHRLEPYEREIFLKSYPHVRDYLFIVKPYTLRSYLSSLAIRDSNNRATIASINSFLDNAENLDIDIKKGLLSLVNLNYDYDDDKRAEPIQVQALRAIDRSGVLSTVGIPLGMSIRSLISMMSEPDRLFLIDGRITLLVTWLFLREL